MFRRSMMELVLPDDIDVGRYAADTYFAFASHLLGSSILIDATVARYTRHGGNAFSDTTVYGAGTLAIRSVGSDWPSVAAILRAHIERNRERFVHQLCTAEPALARLRQAGKPSTPLPDAPPPFVPRVIRRLRHEGRRLRDIARRLRQT